MTFHQRLTDACRERRSLVCVGLDPEETRIPPQLMAEERPFFAFGKQIVDATAEFVAAFKPQAAHFASAGREQELADLIGYIRDSYPQHIVVLDAKRGDVGNTARFYAREAFVRYGAEAVTVNPYLGRESLEPYFEYPECGVVVLCRTSNPESDWLQNQCIDGQPLFLRVAASVSAWDEQAQCMLVAGATYPDELKRIREVAPSLPLLVPGVGAQGGDLERVLAAGWHERGAGILISSSRAIIYAGTGKQFAAAAASAARALNEQIEEILGRI